MARSWLDVARGRASSALRSEAPEFVPAADLFPCIAHHRAHMHSLVPELRGDGPSKTWTERNIVACDDCGCEARLCANGCVLPGNRPGRNRRWICAPCDYAEDVRISQLPYMDLGKLADPDTERKEPFRCVHCHERHAKAARAAAAAVEEKHRLRAEAEAPAFHKASEAREAIVQAYYATTKAEVANAATLRYNDRMRAYAWARDTRRRNGMLADSQAAFERVFREEKARLGL